MSQTAAAIWSAYPSASPDSINRNGYSSSNNNNNMDQPRSNPSFISPAFDLADILNPASRADKRMSLDYASSAPGSAHPQYASSPNDFDSLSASLHAGPNAQQQHANHLGAGSSGGGGGGGGGGGYDQGGDGMDLGGSGAPDQPYEYFSSSNGGNPFGSRYRTNASSSSSLGQGFSALGPDALYPHAPSPFGDSMSAFAPSGAHGPFGDLVGGLPSSYSSGKVSPLTPNDPLGGGLQGPSGFPGLGGGGGGPKSEGSAFAQYDLLNGPERRPSNGGFQSDYHHDDFVGNGALGLAGFPPSSTLQHFQERLGRFEPHGAHYPSNAGGVPSLHHRSSVDGMMRGVNPHATHGVVGGFDDIPPFPSMAPELALRMPGQNIDETLQRMKLQAHVGMGAAATDLQSFIRYACILLLYLCTQILMCVLQTVFGSVRPGV